MRIAIIRLSSFGDVVISSSMLAGLKALGDYRIEWFVDDRFEGILDYSPCISKIHSMSFKKLLKSIGGIFEIRSYCKNCGDFDLVIDMQGLIKSALIGKFLKTKKFIGFSKNGVRESLASYFYTHKVDIAYDANILQRNFSVLFNHILESQNSSVTLDKILSIREQSLGINYRNIDENLKNLFTLANNIEDEKKTYTFLFILEASIQEKMYPIERFLSLANYLNNFLQNCHFYILWHDNEKNADELKSMLSKQSIKATKLPKLDFNSLKFCLKQIDCAIGGDTGVTHLAWAMGINCITLYGNANITSGKNMRNTAIDRVLLGNPYIVSNSKYFEISSIDAREIFETFKYKVYKEL